MNAVCISIKYLTYIFHLGLTIGQWPTHLSALRLVSLHCLLVATEDGHLLLLLARRRSLLCQLSTPQATTSSPQATTSTRPAALALHFFTSMSNSQNAGHLFFRSPQLSQKPTIALILKSHIYIISNVQHFVTFVILSLNALHTTALMLHQSQNAGGSSRIGNCFDIHWSWTLCHFQSWGLLSLCHSTLPVAKLKTKTPVGGCRIGIGIRWV